jgi:2-polyprenyl-6-methoxyphenol hydroxylase-like FAD-dependent oxidoreductase
MEVFDGLGVGGRIRDDAALPLKGLELYRAGGEGLIEFPEQEFREASVQPYSTDPGATRRLLLEKAAGHVDVRRGIDVNALMREDGKITGVQGVCGDEPVQIRARLVVGDDGGHSIVRQGLGISLPTKDFPVDFLGATGTAGPWASAAIGQGWVNPAGIRQGIFAGLFLPLPGARVAMVFGVTPGAHERFKRLGAKAFQDAVAALAPPMADFTGSHVFPDDFAHIRRPFGHAPCYVADGAALIGDAAHPVTPAGGQGANMSVADAVVLAEVAHEALASGECSAAKLAVYETRRRAANERSLRFSARGAQFLHLLPAIPWAAQGAFALLKRVNRSPDTKRRFLQSVASAFRSERT